MKVVCDTSALIRLRKAGILNRLGEMFETVLLPPAVRRECQDSATQAALEQPFFEVRPVTRPLPLTGIQTGEHEAISLAVEHGIKVLIIDDEKAFRKAMAQGLRPVRSFRVLVLAKRKGLMASVKVGLDRTIAQGEGIQDELYQQILAAAGEKMGES